VSAQLGLPTADKPQMACLSSRVPYGETVTPEKLRMIEQAEYVLRDLGFHDVRVRHHEMRSAECGVRNEDAADPVTPPAGDTGQVTSDRKTPDKATVTPLAGDTWRVTSDKKVPDKAPVTHLARIELAPAEIPALLGNGKLATVAGELKKIGYAHVTLDLQGYRRGSTNEALRAFPSNM
jgi:PP-loop superfamily ATP-utilizing enzyme